MRILRPWLLGLMICASTTAHARDFFLTLGGGYSPQGNQASLEANVLFFQRLLSKSEISLAAHKVYFADGYDGGRDLQVMQRRASKIAPATKALSDIFRLNTAEAIIYRNHQVPNISGALRSSDIRDGLTAIQSQLVAGDRLFVYVTAHGGSAKGDNNARNTSISCWGNKPLKMTEFASWLDELPENVTVVSVMAQCYCGGFANTIFESGDADSGFAKNVRCGFFAQQHDLPAAGCRPDVENDEEYSSYFWGAFLGQSRTGKAVGNIDCNNDQRVSLAEAHAYAVVASETIDIPLRTSDAVLRRFSRIDGYDIPGQNDDGDEDSEFDGDKQLAALTGTVHEIASRGRPDETRIIVGLAETLGIPVSSDVSEVTKRYEAQRAEFRDMRRSSSRRPRGSSPRRKLQETVIEKWPELEDPKEWNKSDLLSDDNQAEFLAELEQLDGYSDFLKSNEDRVRAREAANETELRQVKFRRLIQQLESVVLAQNLAAVADADIVSRYQAIVAAEEGFLTAE